MLTLDGAVPDTVVASMIDESYVLVVRGMPKRVREELGVA